MTVGQLMGTMSERELGRWRSYVRQRSLPSRRLEVQVAIVARTLAQVMAGDRSDLDAFLIEYQRKPDVVLKPTDTKTGEMAQVLGFMSGKGVRVLGERRRAREKAMRGLS